MDAFKLVWGLFFESITASVGSLASIPSVCGVLWTH